MSANFSLTKIGSKSTANLQKTARIIAGCYLNNPCPDMLIRSLGSFSECQPDALEKRIADFRISFDSILAELARRHPCKDGFPADLASKPTAELQMLVSFISQRLDNPCQDMLIRSLGSVCGRQPYAKEKKRANLRNYRNRVLNELARRGL
jgi:hypothetical protein